MVIMNVQTYLCETHTDESKGHIAHKMNLDPDLDLPMICDIEGCGKHYDMFVVVERKKIQNKSANGLTRVRFLRAH